MVLDQMPDARSSSAVEEDVRLHQLRYRRRAADERRLLPICNYCSHECSGDFTPQTACLQQRQYVESARICGPVHSTGSSSW